MHNIIIIITVIKLNMVKKLAVSYFTLKKFWDIVQVSPDSPCQIEWTEYTRLQIIQYYSQMASNNNNNNNNNNINNMAASSEDVWGCSSTELRPSSNVELFMCRT